MAVSSHGLARLLLARRDNDLEVQMTVDDDAHGLGGVVEAHRARVLSVSYDPEGDTVVIVTADVYGPSYEEETPS